MKHKFKELKDVLKSEAIEQGKTQRDVADELGKENNNLWRTITAKTIKLKTLFQVLDLLGLDLIIRRRRSKTEYKIKP